MTFEMKTGDEREYETVVGKWTYEVGAPWDGITGKNSSPNAGDEFFPRDNLFAHEVSTALCLDLVLDVHGCNASTDVLEHRTSNHRSATEAVTWDEKPNEAS